MHEQKKHLSIWTVVLIAAGVALLVSAVVTVALNLPAILALRPYPAPDVVGMEMERAQDMVSDKRLVIVPVASESSELDEGSIISQVPRAGERIRRGDIIEVIISKGHPVVQIPKLKGMELAQATRTLQSAGLFVSDVVSHHDTLPEDIIIGTEPVVGVTLEKGSSVKLIVSLGPQLAEVPKVTRIKLLQAQRVIEEQGFNVGDIRYEVTTEYYQETVMRQTPEAGEMAPLGSEINLVVAGVLR